MTRSRIPAWRATVHAATEPDTPEVTQHARTQVPNLGLLLLLLSRFSRVRLCEAP